MKTDSAINEDILDALEWEPSVDHAKNGVAVTNGIVSLSGIVNRYATKIAAEEAARNVVGVRGIAEDIEVHFAGSPKTADAEIAKRIADMLDWNSGDTRSDISVKVESVWVTLSGEVAYHFSRRTAEKLASGMNDVIGVSNLIKVRMVPMPSNIREKIVTALRRAIDVDASNIKVEVTGNKVKLGGQVHHHFERSIAEKVA